MNKRLDEVRTTLCVQETEQTHGELIILSSTYKQNFPEFT